MQRRHAREHKGQHQHHREPAEADPDAGQQADRLEPLVRDEQQPAETGDRGERAGGHELAGGAQVVRDTVATQASSAVIEVDRAVDADPQLHGAERVDAHGARLVGLPGEVLVEDEPVVRRTVAEEAAEDLRAAVIEGALLRVRPIMMTVAAIIAGLLPIMLGDGTGSEVMRRIAAPMVGGMVSATVLTLVVIPALFLVWKRHTLLRKAVSEEAPAIPLG